MNRVVKIAVLLILVAGLVLVRQFEASLFYDPMLQFFKTNHSTQSLPEMDYFKVLYNVAFRYWVNVILSLAILWVVFRNKGILKLSLFLFGILFVVLILVFALLLNASEAGNYMALFYVRRFLIQPLFLLILLPAFYFQKRS